MSVGLGVLLVLAGLTFFLASVLQCVSLRKQENLIERLERLQGPLVDGRADPPPCSERKSVSSHFIRHL